MAGDISYGDVSFCKTHSKSKQGMEAKQAYQNSLQEKERVARESMEAEKKAVYEEKERLRAEKAALEQEIARREQEAREKELRMAEEAAKIEVLKSFEFKREVVRVGDITELNAWGRYEDPESNYVFANKKCYGRQLPDGRVARLTPKDIKVLQQFQVSYQGDGEEEEIDELDETEGSDEEDIDDEEELEDIEELDEEDEEEDDEELETIEEEELEDDDD